MICFKWLSTKAFMCYEINKLKESETIISCVTFSKPNTPTQVHQQYHDKLYHQVKKVFEPPWSSNPWTPLHYRKHISSIVLESIRAKEYGVEKTTSSTHLWCHRQTLHCFDSFPWNTTSQHIPHQSLKDISLAFFQKTEISDPCDLDTHLWWFWGL